MASSHGQLPLLLQLCCLTGSALMLINRRRFQGEPTRATMLTLLVEQENHLGLTRQQLARLDDHISRLSEIMARHVELMDNLQFIGRPLERASMVLATLNDLMGVIHSASAKDQSHIGERKGA